MQKPLRRTLFAAISQSSPAEASLLSVAVPANAHVLLSVAVPANAHVLPSMKPGTGQSWGTAQNRSGVSL